MEKDKIKKELFRQLKKEHCFWSYEPSSVRLRNISDELLIEMVMIHLDLDDIDKLFRIYPYKKIKECWLQRLVPQGEYLYSLNKFLAFWYFRAKNPSAYVKSMETRQLKKIINI